MAEYIDREKLKKHLDIEISFGGLENKLLVFDKIDTCDTADVIERSKIDRAIDEIDFLRQHRAKYITEDNKICIDSEEVLKILKEI